MLLARNQQIALSPEDASAASPTGFDVIALQKTDGVVLDSSTEQEVTPDADTEVPAAPLLW